MQVLDLFCGGGGAAMGYHQVGFSVTGIDTKRQPHYPFEFIQTNALDVLTDRRFLRKFKAIHASPPCQGYSKTQVIQNNEHPKLVHELREMLIDTGLPYIIENVPGSPLNEPVTLCGATFGLRTYRHRLFECSFYVKQPFHFRHSWKVAVMGRPPKPGEFMHIIGNFTDVDEGRKVMEIPWLPRSRLKEAIPPAYTRHIGNYLIRELLT